MLIAISGSQGCGKSTVLAELKSRGYNVTERKTARSILNDWGVTLDVVNQNFELKHAFQSELVKRKYTDEIELALSDELYFTERSFADLFTYSLIAFGQYNEYDAWLDEYYKQCQAHCHNYSHIFYIQSKFSKNIEHDGVRSTNQHYSRMIDTVMFDVTEQMVMVDGSTTSLSTIYSTVLEDRIVEIIQTPNAGIYELD